MMRSKPTSLTPQQYELLHGGGAEAAEISRQRLSRRRFLRRSMLAIWGGSAVAAVSASLDFLYPQLKNQLGGPITVGKKGDFPTAKPGEFKLGQAGIFRNYVARTYIVHLDKETPLLQRGTALQELLSSESILKDADGSYWIALYQRCVHLGCTVPFRDDCESFRCPCHGSHYNVDGEYLGGPAPRSLDRFAIFFRGKDVVVDTGVLNNRVLHPDSSTRLLPQPHVECPPG